MWSTSFNHRHHALFALCSLSILNRIVLASSAAVDNCSVGAQSGRAVRSLLQRGSDGIQLNRNRLAWDMIGPDGVKYSNVVQGELGTCYLLAALASIAKHHAHVIDDMFVARELWNAEVPVYTTQWMVNGKILRVAVDDYAPVDVATGRFVFVHNKDGELWPVVLEKAWAKIFGSYQKISGGRAREVYKAITQAPVDVLTHSEVTLEEIWAKLANAFLAKRAPYPVSASTGSASNIGLPAHHAYAVFGVQQQPLRQVHLYNPWGGDRYEGTVPNPDKTDGLITMTLDEYVSAFDHTTISEMIDGYVISSVTGPSFSSQGDMVMALSFTMSTDEGFVVQVEWPSQRFLSGCSLLEPVVTMAVSGHGTMTFGKHGAPELPVLRAHLPGKAGAYKVFVAAQLPDTEVTWSPEIVVNTYANQQISLSHTADPIPAFKVFYEMIGICGGMKVKGRSSIFLENRDVMLNGLPTFWETGVTHPMIIYWDPIVREEIDSAAHGTNRWQLAFSIELAKSHIHELQPPEMSCVAATLLERANHSKEVSVLAKSIGRDRKEHAVNAARSSLVARKTLEGGLRRRGYDWEAVQPVIIALDQVAHAQSKLLGSSHLLDVLATRSADDRLTISKLRSEVSLLLQPNYNWDEIQAIIDSINDEVATGEAKCEGILERIAGLDNSADIIAQGKDPMFPPSASSIGGDGEMCGDTAAGISKPCSHYDHWDRFPEILRREEDAAKEVARNKQLAEQCVNFRSVGASCIITSHCTEVVELTCDSQEGQAGQKTITHHRLQLRPGAAGSVEAFFCQCAWPI